MKDELEKVKASVQELKTVAFTSNDSLNKKLNDHIERTTRQINQLNSVVEILLKENQELKGILSNQRFVIQPINPFQQGSQVTQSHQNQLASASQNALNLQLGDNFLPTNGLSSTSGHSEVRSQHTSEQNQQVQSQSQQQQQNQQALQTQQQQQAQKQQQTQRAQQAQQGQQSQQQQTQQQQQTSQSQQRGSALQNHQGSTQGQQPPQHHHQSTNGVLDNALGEASTNSGMLRFINNQYVDEEHNLNTQSQASNNPNSRIDFVFMDPSANRSRHYRSGSTNFHDADQDDENSPITHLTPPQGSRLQKSNTRQGEFSAENYDLIIHNDFNKVEDIYYEYYNSLKPQVERVQKAYKIKKIRKYQKIKALAVRIDRYKEIKGCSLEESFRFFDNLRLADDNSKRSIAWLYNTLPDILKRIGLEEQLKKNPGT